ncbi:hypothetical protein C8Q73DRAFT_795830 [Cubamyces lactineus]|nr:hypothetical protein C8Q73DRAFT_795830 [Cubamyces lactineus]
MLLDRSFVGTVSIRPDQLSPFNTVHTFAMKIFAVGLLSLVLLGIGANAAVIPVNVVDTAVDSSNPAEDNTSLTNGTNSVDAPCFWAGSAPYCIGAFCPAGYQDCGHDPCGGTECCTYGQKVRCCATSAGIC